MGTEIEGLKPLTFYSIILIVMTKRNIVSPNVKWNFFPETISYGDWWYEKILIWTATYKGYKFRATHRTYKESNGYDEYENLLQCTTTDEVVAENEINFNQCIVSYVNWLEKNKKTKRIIANMLLKKNFISYYDDKKYSKYGSPFRENYNRPKRKQMFLNEMMKQPLSKLHYWMHLSNIYVAMKLASWDRTTEDGKTYYVGYCLENYPTYLLKDWTVLSGNVWCDCIDTNWDWDWDLACWTDNPFFILDEVWMKF